jgi:imidazolonepropionase-like amidohydrolase
MRKTFVLFLFSFFLHQLMAEVTPAQLSGKIAIKAGRMLDVKTGSVATGVVILVEKDRIRERRKIAPTDATVIDLSNEFVMPGMVDCHAHILGNLKDFIRRLHSSAFFGQGHSLGLVAISKCGWITVSPLCVTQANRIRVTDQLALRDSIKEGLITGPRMVCSRFVHFRQWRTR